MKDCCFDLEKVWTYFFENTSILYNRTSLFCQSWGNHHRLSNGQFK